VTAAVVLLLALQAAESLNRGKDALAAHHYAAAAVQFREAALAAGEPAETLEAFRWLAAASRLTGRADEAEAALKRAAPIAAKLHGDTSLELASVLSSLAGAQSAQGKRRDAILSLESAIRMRELQPAERLAELSADLAGAAAIRIEMGESAAAKPLLVRAVESCEKALPPESPQCLGALDALANLARDGSEYGEAEPLYIRALRLREASFGPDSAELISTLDSLSYVYFGLKRYADAEPLYLRLLALWESSAGKDHPMVTLTLDKMAEFYAAQERFAEADPLAGRAARMRASILLDSLERAGRILASASKPQEAAEVYRRAVLIAEESQAPDKALDPLLRAYAAVLRGLNRNFEAEAVEQRIAALLHKRELREGRREAPEKSR
jgi:hypothetical protein